MTDITELVPYDAILAMATAGLHVAGRQFVPELLKDTASTTGFRLVVEETDGGWWVSAESEDA